MAKVTGGKGLGPALGQIAKRVENAKRVRVGFTEKAKYPDGTPVALVAAIQNYGAPAVNIPPRPFFSDAIRANTDRWGLELGKRLKANNYDAYKALAQTGEFMAGTIARQLQATNSPPLKEKTVKAKGFAKPLVDSGLMLQTLQGPGAYEVEE